MPSEEAGASTEAQTAETQVVETPSFDRSALEEKVSQSLAAAFGDETPETDKSSEASAGEDTTEQTESSEKTEQTEETEQTEDAEKKDEEKEAAAEAGKKPDDAPTLPESYIRSLKAYGWDQEAIDKNLRLLGNDFIVTAAKIHANRNDETARMAEIGRQARQNQEQGQGTASAARPTMEPLKPVDRKVLEEKLGDDPIVDQLITPINAVIERINAILPEVAGHRQAAERAETEALGRQVEEFFGGKDLEPYMKVYGSMKDAGVISDEQVKARNKVLETADALLIGAKIQGRKLSLTEALQTAHENVSGEFKAEAIRTTIKKTLKQREKGITLKPSGSKPSGGGGKVQNRSDLEKKVGSRLRSIFG